MPSHSLLDTFPLCIPHLIAFSKHSLSPQDPPLLAGLSGSNNEPQIAQPSLFLLLE